MPNTFFAALILVGAAAGAATHDAIEQHDVSITTVVSSLLVVLPFVWWLSSRFTKIDDRFDRNDERLKEVEGHARESLSRIESALEKLPCAMKCPEDKK